MKKQRGCLFNCAYRTYSISAGDAKFVLEAEIFEKTVRSNDKIRSTIVFKNMKDKKKEMDWHSVNDMIIIGSRKSLLPEKKSI